MRRRVRALLVVAALVAPVAGVGIASAPPAGACGGEICDSICDFQNQHPTKWWSNGCWFR